MRYLIVWADEKWCDSDPVRGSIIEMGEEIEYDNKLGIYFVKDALQGDASGHDWYHIERVHRLAKRICKRRGQPVYHTFTKNYSN